MTRLTFDDLRALLPALDELRPLKDEALAGSSADASRAWSGSGELASAGDRLVDATALLEAALELADREQAHLRLLYRLCSEAALALEGQDRDGAVESLLEAAALEEERNRPGRASAWADAACRTAREEASPALTSRALRRRARARRAEGRLTEAQRDYAEAHVISTSVNDPQGSAEAAIGCGNVLEEQGLWEEASHWYRRALATLDEEGAPVPEMWHAHLNLHVVLRSVGALDGSRTHLDEAARIANALGDGSAEQFLENARGQLEMAEQRFDVATDHFRRALATATGPRAEVTIRLNLAEALLAGDRPLDAAEEARRAERRALTGHVPQKLPEVYRILGRIAASEGNADAFVLFERALGLIEEQGLPTLERALTLQAYADAEAGAGNEDVARSLGDEAERYYEELGIPHKRREWADRFDGEPSLDDQDRQ